jgi:hypothetical protein
MYQLKQTEAELKQGVQDYLQYKQNQGVLYFDRLNSGEAIIETGDSRRRIMLCRPGTADMFLILKGSLIFLELKTETGKQSPEQKEFEAQVTWHGAEYYVIRSLDELIKLVEG